MKFSSQEEYGLRCLLRIAKESSQGGLTIPEISNSEGMTIHNVAKILRILRLGGFLESSRGQIGGYALSRRPEEILVGDVLNVLGGKLYDGEFCKSHKGVVDICSNSIDCSIRSLWQTLQLTIDGILEKMTLRDLLATETTIIGTITNYSAAKGKETIIL